MKGKKRYILSLSIAILSGLLALVFIGLRGSVTREDRRDFAAELFRGKAEERYMQLCVYPTADAMFIPDRAMMTLRGLEDALLGESISPEGKMLFSASAERSASATFGEKTSDVCVTVYFGNFFGLHPEQTVAGSFPMEGATAADYCVIDDLLAWRLFGSYNVCGMEIELSGRYYTITGVVAAERGKYASYYGTAPRAYVRYDSALYRDENIAFTRVEAVLPDPVKNFAKDIFEKQVGDLGSVYAITGRFEAAALFEKCKSLTKLGVLEGESLPYEENIARIREVKCAYFFLAECAMLAIAAVAALCLLFFGWHDVQKSIAEHKRKKNTHAFQTERNLL